MPRCCVGARRCRPCVATRSEVPRSAVLRTGAVPPARSWAVVRRRRRRHRPPGSIRPHPVVSPPHRSPGPVVPLLHSGPRIVPGRSRAARRSGRHSPGLRLHRPSNATSIGPSPRYSPMTWSFLSLRCVSDGPGAPTGRDDSAAGNAGASVDSTWRSPEDFAARHSIVSGRVAQTPPSLVRDEQPATHADHTGGEAPPRDRVRTRRDPLGPKLQRGSRHEKSRRRPTLPGGLPPVPSARRA